MSSSSDTSFEVTELPPKVEIPLPKQPANATQYVTEYDVFAFETIMRDMVLKALDPI